MSDGGARGADEERPEPAWPGAAHPPLGDDLVANPEGARGDDRLGRAERRRPAERDGAGGTVRGQPGPGPRGLPRSGAVGTDPVRRQSRRLRSEEHTSELQSLMRISYAVVCLKKKTKQKT